MDTQDILSIINKTGRRLSKGQKAIVEYIANHADKAAFMTAARLGESVGVSESTVVRFAIALGYDGYPSLQRALQELIRNRLTTVQRVELAGELDEHSVLEQVLKSDIQNIRRTLEGIDEETFTQVIDHLYSARRVYVTGVRSSAPIAQFLGYYLNFLLDNVTVVIPGISDVIEQIVRIGEGDVMLGVSFPRYSARTIEAMRFAGRQGALVVALTDSPVSPVGETAQYCLTARSDMASFVDSLVAPLSLVNALMVAMSLRRKEQISEYFARMEGLWSEGKVYTPDA